MLFCQLTGSANELSRTKAAPERYVKASVSPLTEKLFHSLPTFYVPRKDDKNDLIINNNRSLILVVRGMLY